MSSSERGLGDRGERVVVPEGQIVSSTAGKKLEGLRHLSGVKGKFTPPVVLYYELLDLPTCSS